MYVHRQVEIGRQNERQSWPSGTTQNATTTNEKTKSATMSARAEERFRETETERERERARCCFLLTQQMEYEMPLEAPLRIRFVMHFPLISLFYVLLLSISLLLCRFTPHNYNKL